MKKETKEEIINRFTKNLNQCYREGGMLNTIGREKEIKQIIQILSRLVKNNPLLIGYPGVGKSALVEGLVQQIEKKKYQSIFLIKKCYN